jgi:hypothetical protein
MLFAEIAESLCFRGKATHCGAEICKLPQSDSVLKPLVVLCVALVPSYWWKRQDEEIVESGITTIQTRQESNAASLFWTWLNYPTKIAIGCWNCANDENRNPGSVPKPNLGTGPLIWPIYCHLFREDVLQLGNE